MSEWNGLSPHPGTKEMEARYREWRKSEIGGLPGLELALLGERLSALENQLIQLTQPIGIRIIESKEEPMKEKVRTSFWPVEKLSDLTTGDIVAVDWFDGERIGKVVGGSKKEIYIKLNSGGQMSVTSKKHLKVQKGTLWDTR